MQLFTLIVTGQLMVCSVGCTSEAAPSVATTTQCRTAAPVAEGSVTESMIEAVDRARLNDQRCGPPDERTRVCRALFVVGELDPARLLDDREQLERAVDATVWVTSDAAEVAEPPLTGALAELAVESRSLLSSSNDDVADAILHRANPKITEPIDDAWTDLCV